MADVNKEDAAMWLGNIISSPGWTQLLKPACEMERNRLILALVQGGYVDQNKNPVSDEQIKGHIKSLSWVLGWENAAEQAAARLREMAQEPEESAPAVGTPYGEGEANGPSES